MNYKINQENIIIILIAILAVIVVFGFARFASAPKDLFSSKESNLEGIEIIEAEKLEAQKVTTLIFTGDIMLSRTVNAKMARYNDYTWPFSKVSDFLNQADLVIGNLESPFLNNSNSYEVLSGSFSFKANPLAIEGLKLANFSLLSLANNHTINQGKQGIVDTMEILEKNGIKHVGAGLNEKEARRAEIININGYNFAFLAYAYPDDYSVATNNRAGIANMDIEKMKNDIRMLKESEVKADLIIILMHAGNEYKLHPNWQQKDFAKAAIDAGADIIIGHHPHWPQVFDFYQGKPIIYSLGNFVFDQMWSEETRQGLLLKLSWKGEIKSLELIPTKIYDYGQVKILNSEIETERVERESILTKIKANISGLIYEKE